MTEKALDLLAKQSPTTYSRALGELAEQLKRVGFQPDEITAELRQRKATWKKEVEANLATNLARQRAAENRQRRQSRRALAQLWPWGCRRMP